MTAHRLDNAGALTVVAEPLPHPVEWRLADKHGWFDKPDVVFFTQKWVPKWSHTYMITGVLGGLGMVFKTVQTRTFYVKIGNTKLWEARLGTVRGGAVNALVSAAVPINALWTAPDETEVELTVGMTRGSDQDWELDFGVHTVNVVDLGCLA